MLLPKFTRQDSKSSVSHETSSKTHTSSLQNERFVRDVLQNARVKSPKRAFRTTRFFQDSLVKSPKRAFRFHTRRSPKVTRQSIQTSISYETSSKSQAHTSSSPAKQFRDPPPNNTRSHANPNVTATLTSKKAPPPDPELNENPSPRIRENNIYIYIYIF